MTNLVIFRGRLGALPKCFYCKIFRIELRCEWVNTKNLEFFHGMLVHSSVLWKRVLVSWGYILKTTKATHSNVIPFDSEYTTSY